MSLGYEDHRLKTSSLKARRRYWARVAAALTALVALVVLSSLTVVSAEENSYTEASLQGDYGFVGAYGGDVARLVGTAHFDGRGNLTHGSARVVITGGTVKSITYTGTYTMNPDGTGNLAITVYGVAIPPPVVHEDFVITKARLINGAKVATEVQDAQEEPSVVVTDVTSFVTHTYTRRPDESEHR